MLVQSCCLTDHCSLHRDLVHRQTASAVVQHMSLGVYGFGCEDSLNHLLNYVWPNVFETSPHVIQAVMGALEGLRVAIGPCRMLQYCLQVCPHVCSDSRYSSYQAGLLYFFPGAKKVRWRWFPARDDSVAFHLLKVLFKHWHSVPKTSVILSRQSTEILI